MLKALSFRPGQVLTYQDLRKTERNLNALKIFSGVQVYVMDPVSRSVYKEIGVKVQE